MTPFHSGFVTVGCCGAVLGEPHMFGCEDAIPCDECGLSGGDHASDCAAVLLAEEAAWEAHLARRAA